MVRKLNFNGYGLNDPDSNIITFFFISLFLNYCPNTENDNYHSKIDSYIELLDIFEKGKRVNSILH